MINKSKVYDVVKKRVQEDLLIEKGDHVILGLSGGADSMCLFAVLLELKEELEFTFSAVHLNHMIRGAEADMDQQFVEAICKGTGVEEVSYKKDCQNWAQTHKLSVEEAGRELRYESYFDTATEFVTLNPEYEYKQIKIATAHTLDDQAETILMKIIRGTSLDGLGGIEYKRTSEQGSEIIRPLLDVEKKDVLSFCALNNVPFAQDSTNEESQYTRNKVRLELIPFIQNNFNQNFSKALVENMTKAKRDSEYIWAKVQEDYERILMEEKEGELYIDKDIFLDYDVAVRNRIIIRAFEELGLKKSIGYAHLANLNEKFKEATWTGTIVFPKSYRVDVGNTLIRLYNSEICKQREETEGNFFEGEKVEPENKPKIIVMAGKKEDYESKEGEIALDYTAFLEKNESIKDPVRQIVVRTRESGDYLPLKNGAGRKKMQDVFVDMKVPREDRNQIWMLALGQEIIWIPEGKMRSRVTGNYEVNEDTKTVLVLKVKND